MNSVKVVLVGDSGIGKSAITYRFVKGAYSPTDPTVGADILTKSLNIHGQRINLAIWDTAGQEAYRTLTPMYYRDASIVIIVFAVGEPNQEQQISRSSFDSVSHWYNDVKDISNNAIIVLCGNMNDLENREISFEEGSEKAAGLSIEYFETSALNGDGIETLFEKSLEAFLESAKDQQMPTPTNGKIDQPVQDKVPKAHTKVRHC